MKSRLALVIATLWWGALTTLGFWVVPMLFAHLPAPALAGGMAARLFSTQTWVSMGCGLLLWVIFRSKWHEPSVTRSYVAIVLVSFSMLAALLVEFGVAPRILARENLRFWHGAGSALYGLQWLVGGALVVWLMRDPDA